ncbi:MAG: hypothetical protein AAF985_05940 [Bacteroidota bacterium]
MQFIKYLSIVSFLFFVAWTPVYGQRSSEHVKELTYVKVKDYKKVITTSAITIDRNGYIKPRRSHRMVYDQKKRKVIVSPLKPMKFPGSQKDSVNLGGATFYCVGCKDCKVSSNQDRTEYTCDGCRDTAANCYDEVVIEEKSVFEYQTSNGQSGYNLNDLR